MHIELHIESAEETKAFGEHLYPRWMIENRRKTGGVSNRGEKSGPMMRKGTSSRYRCKGEIKIYDSESLDDHLEVERERRKNAGNSTGDGREPSRREGHS